MLFNSLSFLLVFLPIVLAGFFFLPAQPRALRKAWLLAASLAFYGVWRIEGMVLITTSILFNFWVAENLLRWRDTPKARNLMWAGVGGNLLLLGYFKYAGFFVGIMGAITGQHFPFLHIVLPLAISFFTFTQIAYIVDVYRDHTRHYGFLDYALFVLLFPHLIAGPIVRHWEIIPQYVDRDLRPSRSDLTVGAALFLLGLFKKAILADTLSVTANAVFGAAVNGTPLTFFDAWFGTLAYTLQLYFDFSGYSDMAIGLARLFGIRFPGNFNSPYQASSIRDFWGRWHMTLTRFLREYVYFPLGGNRCSPPRHIANVMTVLLLSGLWHGAGWTFIIWGGMHGIFLVIAGAWKEFCKAMQWELDRWQAYRFACAASTFLVVTLAWVLFRSPDFQTARHVYAAMAGFHGFTVPHEVGQAELGLGKLTTLLGGTIVPGTIPQLSYQYSIHFLVAMLLVAWLFPNSQQWLASREPILEVVPPRGRWRLPLNLPIGIAFGIAFFFYLRTFFGVQASPFLYFNF